MTYLSAKRLGIDEERGLLKKDYYADIVVFDPDQIAIKQLMKIRSSILLVWNMYWSMVRLQLENGKQTDVCAGRVIRNPHRFGNQKK